MVLSDGRRVIIDATSAAASGNKLLIVGASVHALGSEASRVQGDQHATAIGVLRDASGGLALVPSPLADTPVREPQLAPADDGGWHAVFVVGRPGTRWNPGAYDSADVWYGHYSGSRWTGVHRIAAVRAALLSLPSASAPTVVGADIAFAFPFDASWDRRANATGDRGVLMVRGHGEMWRIDTLRTWAAPQSIQLIADSGGLVRAYLAQEYFVNGRPRGPALFVATHSGPWSPTTLMHDPAPKVIGELLVTGTGRTAQLAWRSYTPGVGNEAIERAAVVGGVITRAPAVSTVRPTDRPALLTLDSLTTLWLVRNGSRDAEMHAITTSHGAAQDTTVVNVPLSNFVIVASRLANGQVVVVTGGPDTTKNADPPFVSYLTELAVSCRAVRHH